MSIPRTETVSADKTMSQLWARVRQRGDLPGFSKVVRIIIGAMRGDDDREFNMTRTVLSDPALTQKVLRLANSAMYSVFGQDVNTVSKAVIVLGTEAIGHLALGLKLIDGLSAASTESERARSEMEKAVLAGHIARQVASSASRRDAEEAVVCSMLHTLGRMMVAFYLPDQWQRIQARCAESGMREEQVAVEVLGLGLDDIGRLAARRWSLPAPLIDTLKDVEPQPVEEPLDHADWLAAVATLSSRCADAVCSGGGEEASDAILALAGDFADMLGLDVPQLLDAVELAQQTLAEEAVVEVHAGKGVRAERRTVPPHSGGKPVEAIDILTRGVSDMRGAVRTASTGQLLTMALETVYQGLGFSRAVVFLRDQERGQYNARMCFGDGVQELLSRLVFDDAYQPDVFHAALANDKIVFVENAQEPSFTNKVPRWWKASLPTVRSFMVLPLTVDRRPVGFIYGDWDIASPAAKIESHEFMQLNELRVLVVQAVEQRRQEESVWARRML
ncbi:HDOD domain-containing protein [Noviherbaspirillum cavernae]|uniref:HDOD domain-containing protein n=1 Tax=Noviherbaspirillum cavernae TaxID=2320862 RepID=A0A418X4F6_9BURK|nr:HDOD domain-containing protein [Noviherbaspirillum cavernae]RJG07271.1 HDOD domain-containing protein [Noviherbaspirillum cavernae]